MTVKHDDVPQTTAQSRNQKWEALIQKGPCLKCGGSGWGELHGFFGCGAYRRKCEPCDGTGQAGHKMLMALAAHMWKASL